MKGHQRGTTQRHERDRETENEGSPSAGWLETYRTMDVEPPSDALAAALREDRPEHYRRKHILGVSS